MATANQGRITMLNKLTVMLMDLAEEGSASDWQEVAAGLSYCAERANSPIRADRHNYLAAVALGLCKVMQTFEDDYEVAPF